MILTHTYTHFHAIDTVIHAVPLVTLVFAPEASVLHLGWACTKHLELHNKHTTPPDVTSTGYFNTKAFVYSVADIFLRLTASQVERKRCTNIYRGLDGWSHSVIVVACWMQNSHKSYNSALYTELVWPLLCSFSFFFCLYTCGVTFFECLGTINFSFHVMVSAAVNSKHSVFGSFLRYKDPAKFSKHCLG